MQNFDKSLLEIDQVLEVKKIRKNKWEKEVPLQRTQHNFYCHNNVNRMDLATMAKIGCVPACDIADSREYGR